MAGEGERLGRWLKKIVEQAERGVPLDQNSACPIVTRFEQQTGQGLCWAGGDDARRNLFLLEDGVVYLNHGSYGATLR